jgi:biopolymer transport protein ExbB/TolQ
MNSSHIARRGTTEVSLALAFLLAAPLYGGILASEESLPEAFRIVLFERGWVQHAILILTCLALSILALKTLGLFLQRRALRRAPTLAAETVVPLERARALFDGAGLRGIARSVFHARVVRLLEAHTARPDAQETGAENGKASDTDLDAVASSFSMVKVLVWAIPIVGFIGTVVGIGDSVIGFSESLKDADQLDAIKGSLAKVTLGLSIAFDTTLLSLITSILVMLPMTYLQRTEERLVRDVDDYAAGLVRILPSAAQVAEAVAAPAAPMDPEEVKRWIAESIAPTLGELVRAHTALLEKMAADVQVLSGAVQSLAPSLERAVGSLEEATRTAERANGQARGAEDQLCRELGASRQLLQLLAAGLPPASPTASPTASRGLNGTHGTNGVNGVHASAPREI